MIVTYNGAEVTVPISDGSKAHALFDVAMHRLPRDLRGRFALHTDKGARETHGQRATSLYWAIQPFLVFGLLDTVRTMLVDYVAELYADADAAGAETLPQQAKAAFMSAIEPFINIIGARTQPSSAATAPPTRSPPRATATKS